LFVVKLEMKGLHLIVEHALERQLVSGHHISVSFVWDAPSNNKVDTEDVQLE